VKKSVRLDNRLSPAQAWAEAVEQERSRALAWLTDDGGSTPERAVHQARRACKRLRALLRLAEPVLGEPATDARRWVAASARQLAPARDATVRARTLESMLARYAGVLDATAVADLQARFAIEAPGEMPEHARGDAVATLEALGELLADAGLQRLSRRSMLRGAKLAYRKARRRWRVARKGDDPADWHALRSAAQVHLNQLKALRDITAGHFRARQRRLNSLVKLLGDAHDLAMLRVALDDQRGSDAAGLVAELLLPALQAEELACYTAAGELAAKVFDKRPRVFRERLDQAWVDARSDDELGDEHSGKHCGEPDIDEATSRLSDGRASQ